MGKFKQYITEGKFRKGHRDVLDAHERIGYMARKPDNPHKPGTLEYYGHESGTLGRAFERGWKSRKDDKNPYPNHKEHAGEWERGRWASADTKKRTIRHSDGSKSTPPNMNPDIEMSPHVRKVMDHNNKFYNKK